MTTLLEARSAGWVCPVLAAVTVAGVCLALTELCPLLFTVLVALASPEWKVLTRSMTYESTTTGSPVLAVFTAGKYSRDKTTYELAEKKLVCYNVSAQKSFIPVFFISLYQKLQSNQCYCFLILPSKSKMLYIIFPGSLAAILAFACPLSHMITLMNASHLLGITVQAFHFIIMRCVPTAEQKEAGG